MTWRSHRRRRLQRWGLRVLALLVLLGLTATLAAALQVRRIRVEGASRFPPAEVEAVLRSALGSPTLAVRPDDLRDAVRRLPWIADAQVRISLDGVVACNVTERIPVAVAADGASLTLVDHEGRLLRAAGGAEELPRLEGFAPHPEERAALLAALAELGTAWGRPVQRAVRLGPRDVRLGFGGEATEVVVDPTRPANLATARRVHVAWTAIHGAPPLLLDARVDRRVAVVSAPVVAPPGGEVS